MSLRRRVAGSALALALVVLLAGCSVEPGGVVGLTLDSGGQPVAVVSVCKGYIDGVTVWLEEDGKERDLGSWRRETAIRDEAALSLKEPGTGWATARGLGSLPAGPQLHIYGWTAKNRWSAPGPAFTTSDLAALRPSEVWYERYDADKDESVMAFVSRDQFRAEACQSL